MSTPKKRGEGEGVTIATLLVYVMAGLAVVNAYQRVTASVEADMPTLAGMTAILYLGYSCLKARTERKP